MAENEKLNPESYRAKRKKIIFYQRIVLGALAVLLVLFSVLYFKTEKARYVYYTEDGNAVHYAHLTEKGKEYFEVDKLNGSHAYVSTLIETMSANFTYNLTFDTDKVKYSYSYEIETQVEVLDIVSGAPLYNPIVVKQAEPVYVTGEGNSFSIKEQVNIDFCKYDKMARDFIVANNLQETSSSVIVRMRVSVVGASESFASDHSNEYVTELRIPLRKLAFKPVVSSTVPAGEQKILAVSSNLRLFFGILSIVLLVAIVADSATFAYFIIHTRDNYLDYAHRVEKIRKNYKSYIQKIAGEFPMSDCKVLRINNFNELLEVRDVVQKPILMYETPDKTCTRFVISSDGLVYLHEIKEKFGDSHSDRKESSSRASSEDGDDAEEPQKENFFEEDKRG